MCKQAQKEGNKEVINQLEIVMKICMEEKQRTLRPEIQLLNTLLAMPSADARNKVSLKSSCTPAWMICEASSEQQCSILMRYVPAKFTLSSASCHLALLITRRLLGMAVNCQLTDVHLCRSYIPLML